LPPKIDIPEGRLEITFHFGMSMASDYDNPVKTSAMSLSFAIFSPFSLSASDFALAIKSCNCLILSTTFKNGFNGREIAIDTIKGKSKNFNKLMNDKLQEIKTDLAVNGKQTKEKKSVS
jgi:hypothetical protein